MRLIASIMLRLRLQRRRHRHLPLLVAALVAVCVFTWLKSSEVTIGDIIDADHCSYLPNALCDWAGLKQPTPSGDGYRQPDDALRGKVSGSLKDTSPLSAASRIQDNQYTKALDKETLAKGHQFYKSVFTHLLKAAPSIKNKLDSYRDGPCGSDRYQDDKTDPFFSEDYLGRFLQLSNEEVDSLTKSHDYIMSNLPKEAPKGLYKGDGIVFVGGGKFNWLTLLAIRSLRGAGCKLPIEVIIPTLEEYESDVCDRLFAAMDTKCIHLPTVLFGDDKEFANRFSFKGYQYKPLAILLSSFENVLLLDSDNIATYNPAHLFTSEPFLSNGLIVWPDYWRRTTSPSFYKVAGVEVSETKLLPKYYESLGFYKDQEILPKDTAFFTDVRYHERVGAIPDPSTESGQLVFSKRTHLDALFLALYYNTYGPDFYYPLFSQGAPGEGDKETFLAAASVLGKPFYQVGRFLASLGTHKSSGYRGHGMGQYDPVQDYSLTLQKRDLAKRLLDKELQEAVSALPPPRMLFLHANFPKLDPMALKKDGETVDEDGRYRLYGYDVQKMCGVDVELDLWEHMRTLLCKYELNMAVFEGVERKELCDEVNAQHKFLEETHHKMTT